MPTILAIESSCDETSAAVIRNGKVLNNIIASQSDHTKYGGVVPELASRAHQRNIVRVVAASLQEAAVEKRDLDAVAFTTGPGLMGSLLVGASFAKGLALSLGIPLVEVNHMQAHILAHFIRDTREPNRLVPSFPFLCLTVSGGHTQLVVVKDYLDFTIIGETQDDAAGEAFDKAAKILGLPYPGGPLIDRYASTGNPARFKFPNTDMPGLDFSFSGIKTAFLYFIRDEKLANPNFVEENLADICASIQGKIISMLMDRLTLAARQTGIKTIALAGGVSANTGLRAELKKRADRQGWTTFVPDIEYCTDNAAMIAAAGEIKFNLGKVSSWDAAPTPNLSFTTV
jgi:N6-L-threonylcarbamoyladenine synthase